MAGPETVCPHCKGRMEEGYLLDSVYGGYKVASWLAGPLERSIWSGIAVKGKPQRPVQTFRCTSCGFLTSYAK